MSSLNILNGRPQHNNRLKRSTKKHSAEWPLKTKSIFRPFWPIEAVFPLKTRRIEIREKWAKANDSNAARDNHKRRREKMKMKMKMLAELSQVKDRTTGQVDRLRRWWNRHRCAPPMKTHRFLIISFILIFFYSQLNSISLVRRWNAAVDEHFFNFLKIYKNHRKCAKGQKMAPTEIVDLRLDASSNRHEPNRRFVEQCVICRLVTKMKTAMRPVDCN